MIRSTQKPIKVMSNKLLPHYYIIAALLVTCVGLLSLLVFLMLTNITFSPTKRFYSEKLGVSFLYPNSYELRQLKNDNNCAFIIYTLQAESCLHLLFGKGEQENWHVSIYSYPNANLTRYGDDLLNFIIQELQLERGNENIRQIDTAIDTSGEQNFDANVVINMKAENTYDRWGSRQAAIHIVQNNEYTHILVAHTAWFVESSTVNSFIQLVNDSFALDR